MLVSQPQCLCTRNDRAEQAEFVEKGRKARQKGNDDSKASNVANWENGGAGQMSFVGLSGGGGMRTLFLHTEPKGYPGDDIHW